MLETMFVTGVSDMRRKEAGYAARRNVGFGISEES